MDEKTPLTPTSVPELRGKCHPPGPVYPDGYDGRYRVYTVDHLPFGVLPDNMLASLSRDDRVRVGPGFNDEQAYNDRRQGYMVYERDAAQFGLPVAD